MWYTIRMKLEAMKKMRAQGSTYRYIGEKFGVTKQRISQMLNPSRVITGRDFVRSKVRNRDGNKCQSCGKIWEIGMRKFDVHHLEGECGKKTKKYDRISDMHKLITLCHKCHFNHYTHSFRNN